MRMGLTAPSRIGPIVTPSPNAVLKLTLKRTSKNGSKRPKPAGRGRYPISIVKASFDPFDCPVFGEQFDNITASLRSNVIHLGI
jgi:hypothetical protein